MAVACSKIESDQRAVELAQQPIIPPRFAGGIDFANGDDWPGISLSDVENGYVRRSYQGRAITYPGGPTRLCAAGMTPPMSAASWGTPASSSPVLFISPFAHGASLFDSPDVYLDEGYTGTITMKSRPGSEFSTGGQHTYVLRPRARITRDGVPMTLEWSAGSFAAGAPLNALYDAAAYTFAPQVPPLPTGGTCVSASLLDDSGGCVVLIEGTGLAAVGMVAVGLGFSFTVNQGAESAATPLAITIQVGKHFRWEHSRVLLRGDPTKSMLRVKGGVTPACEPVIGQTYSGLIASCVAVTGDPVLDGLEVQKLSPRPGVETYAIDGGRRLALELRASTLGPEATLDKCQKPTSEDTIVGISLRTFQARNEEDNEHALNDPKLFLDYHGFGLVSLEFGRLLEAALQAGREDVCSNPDACPTGQAPRRSLGDPACLSKNVTLDAATMVPTFPQGCTGLEGMYTTAPFVKVLPPDEPFLKTVAGGFPTPSPSPFGDDLGFNLARLSGTTWGVRYCRQPSLFAMCNASSGGMKGEIVATTRARIIQALGKGNDAAVPAPVRSGALLRRSLAAAFFKYLLAQRAGDETVEGVHGAAFSPTDLRLEADELGWAAVYLDRTGADASGPITFRLRLGDDITTSGYSFRRHFDRGERAVLQTVADPVSGVPPGGPGTDLRFSNVFGSRVLTERYGPQPACAVATKPTTGCAHLAPTDAGRILSAESGAPLLSDYSGALAGGGALAIGAAAIAITKQLPAVGSVVVGLPQRAQPFSPALYGPAPSFTATVPFTPKALGGYERVGATGQLEVIPAATADFYGMTISASIAFDDAAPAPAPILAVRSRRFFGHVFLCADPKSDDLLALRAGDPLDAAIAWIEGHPDGVSVCGLVTTPDGSGTRITARTHGVSARFATDGGLVEASAIEP